MAEITDYKYFAALAEAGSFTKTASRCSVSQSAVSQRIRNLEDELGVKLHLTTPHGVILTEEGKAILPIAKKIINDAEKPQEILNEMRGLLRGELRIGVGGFIEPYIRKAVVEFHEQYPNIYIKATFAKAAILNKLLCENEIDIACTMNRAYCSENIDSSPCIPFTMSCVMPSTHVLASKDIVTWEDIILHDVLLPDSGERVYDSIQQELPEGCDLKQLRVIGEVNDCTALLEGTLDLNCITFMPSLNVMNRSDLVAKPISVLQKKLVSNVHRKKDTPLAYAAEKFLTILKNFSVPYFNAIEDFQ